MLCHPYDTPTIDLPVKIFLLDTNTGITKIPSFQLDTGISPSSSTCIEVLYFCVVQDERTIRVL